MTEISQTIPSFIGGVSQQSSALRLPNQSELEVNVHATVADGLMKRPNTDLVKLLGSVAGSNFKMHKINRDASEKYIVLFTADATNPVRVFDLDGTEKTITYGRFTDEDNTTFVTDTNVKSYLTSGITSAKKQIKTVTAADYTFVVNTQKTVAKSSSTTAARTDVAFAWFKKGHPGAYSVNVNYEVGGSPTSPQWAASNGEPTSYGNTNFWAAAFRDGNPAPSNVAITGGQIGNVMSVKPIGTTDANSLYLSSCDPSGGDSLICINECEVRGLDQLPPTLPEGDIIMKVGGDGDTNQDDYFMKFDFTKKTWTEDCEWGSQYHLDETTMPHCLIRQSDGTFRFARMQWVDRYVGDDTSNPFPSFVGSKIQNVGFGKNRLWFTSEDNLIGSKAGEYFDFFRTTVMDVLDDDPIDIAGAGENVNLLRSLKIFDKSIMLFSDERQFALTSGDNAFTPKTVALDETTAYDCDEDHEPVKIGADVYFASPRTDYLSIREYMVMPDSLITDAPDVTSHVPRYIPAGDVTLFGCNSLDMLFVHSSGDPTAIYAHSFLWDGPKKVMQAWRKWSFAHTIVGAVVIKTVMYILFYDAAFGYRLDKIRLENTPLSGRDFRYNLDGLSVLGAGSYGEADTTFTLPYSCSSTASLYQLIDASDNTEYTGTFTISGTTLTVVGADVHSTTFYFGRRYTSQYRFSETFMRKDNGEAIVDGTLVWRKLVLHFKSSGYFKVAITTTGRDDVNEPVMTGVRVSESVIGAVTLLSGEYDFAIHGDSKDTTVEIQSDSYLPFYIPTGIKKFNFNVKGQFS